jgi:regulator of sigma D
MNYTTTTNRQQANATTTFYYQAADKSFSECRQRLICYLIKLNNSLNEDLADLSHALLNRFCDSLVDYLSAGHFRVFQRIALLPSEYAAIEASTRTAMHFNDRFGQLREIRISEVKAALECLAQELSTRFELEDDLLGKVSA